MNYAFPYMLGFDDHPVTQEAEFLLMPILSTYFLPSMRLDELESKKSKELSDRDTVASDRNSQAIH